MKGTGWGSDREEKGMGKVGPTACFHTFKNIPLPLAMNNLPNCYATMP